jgi:four helix bundle protein
MTSQIRRASTSVPSNIAEGYGRESTPDYIRFLRIAQGSLKELEMLLLLAQSVELFSQEAAAPLLADTDRVGGMLRNQIRSLQAKLDQ